MTYKIGDRVMVVNDLFCKSNNGLIGIITESDSKYSSFLYKVKFSTVLNSGQTYGWFRESEITLAKNYIVQQIINDL